MNREEILALLKAHLPELTLMGIRSLALFGSVARAEATADSDIELILTQFH